MTGVTASTSDWQDAGTYPSAAMQHDGASAYIPEIWAGKLIERWYNASVIAAITSTDYEGEIKNMGDNIVIRAEPAIAINNYTLGQVLDYEVPASTAVNLAMSNAKSWSFQIDDVVKTQSDINLMSTFADGASESLKTAVDSAVLTLMKATAATVNIGADCGAISGTIQLGVENTPIAVTEANAVEYILRLGQVLDEQNTPDTGRWVVIPAAFAAVLKDSVLKEANKMGDDTSVVRNGKIGMVDRFTVYVSNNLPSGLGTQTNEFVIYAGVPSACAFASQIVKNETLPNPDTFGELMRGLQVFGYATVKTEGIAEGRVTVAHTT